MNNEDDIVNFIKQKMDKLHKSQNPKDIEIIKKKMKKNVSFFERSNLLSYLILEQMGSSGFEIKNSEKTQHSKKQRNEAQTSEPLCMLWCNIALDDEEKIDKFYSFIAEKSDVNKDDLKEYKNMGKYSFINARKNSANKIVKFFSSQGQITFENSKVNIRYRKYKR